MALKTFKNDKELLADEVVVAAIAKAVAKAVKAETARAVAAVKAVELADDLKATKVLALAAAAIKAVI